MKNPAIVRCYHRNSAGKAQSADNVQTMSALCLAIPEMENVCMYNTIIKNVVTLATTIVALLLLTGWLLFARQPTALASPFAQDATPTPAAEEEHTHSHEEAASDVMTDTAASDESAEPTLHDLMHQIEALQAQVDELQAGTHAGHAEASANEVVTAIYLLDTAGLHALDERLNQEKVINAGDSGNVARVAGLLASVVWPESLAANATTLIDLLNSLSTALENDDVATAAPLSTQVHEAQHEFSHGVEHWLADMPAPDATHNEAGQAFRVTSAVYLLDTVGPAGRPLVLTGDVIEH